MAKDLEALRSIMDPIPVRLETKMKVARSALIEEIGSLVKGYWRSHPQSPLFYKHTLFGPSDEGRREVSNTKALAWLLNPSSDHGWGAKPLRHFLERTFPQSGARWASIEVDSVRAETWDSNGKRNDIVAKGRVACAKRNVKWELVIEAKIDAGIAPGQLQNYVDELSAKKEVSLKLLALLSPRNHHATDKAFPRQKQGVTCGTCTFFDLAVDLLSLVDDGSPSSDGASEWTRLFVASLLRDVEGLLLPIDKYSRQIEISNILERLARYKRGGR